MQMVRAVLGGEYVSLAVECEAAFGNSVGHPPNGGAEIRMSLEVLVEIVEAQHDVAQPPLPVRHMQFGDNRAVGCDLGNEAVGIGQRVEIHRRSIRQFAERATLKRSE